MRVRPTTKAALSIVTGLAALTALTACSGSSSADGPSSAPAPTSSAGASASPAASTGGGTQAGPPDMTAFRDCMAENGVTLPDMGAPASGAPTGMPTGAPPSGAMNGPGQFPLPDGVDQATFDEAQQACASLAPTPGGPGGAGVPDIDASAMAAFTSCLGDNGVTVPAGQDPLRVLDRTDAAVKAAMDTCAPLLPAPAATQ